MLTKLKSFIEETTTQARELDDEIRSGGHLIDTKTESQEFFEGCTLDNMHLMLKGIQKDLSSMAKELSKFERQARDYKWELI